MKKKKWKNEKNKSEEKTGLFCSLDDRLPISLCSTHAVFTGKDASVHFSQIISTSSYVELGVICKWKHDDIYGEAKTRKPV